MTPADHSNPEPEAVSWLDRRWRRLIGYPSPTTLDGRSLQRLPNPVDAHDFIKPMRNMMRLTFLVIVGAVLLLVGSIVGYVPDWVMTFWPMVVPVLVFVFVPGTAAGVFSLLLSSRKPEQAEEWERAGLPFSASWMTWRAPMTPATYRAYRDALIPDPRYVEKGVAHRQSISAHLVWWLHAHSVSPETAGEFVRLGVHRHDVPVAVAAGLSVDEWASLVPTPPAEGSNAGRRVDWCDARVITNLWRWCLYDTAGIDPVSGQRLDRAALLAVVRSWRLAGLPANLVVPCTQRNQSAKGAKGHAADVCPDCGAVGGLHRYRFHDWRPPVRSSGDWRPAPSPAPSVAAWVALAGAMAPYALRAGISFGEVEAMLVESPEQVSAEAFEMLEAFSRPAPRPGGR